MVLGIFSELLESFIKHSCYITDSATVHDLSILTEKQYGPAAMILNTVVEENCNIVIYYTSIHDRCVIIDQHSEA